MMNTHDFFFNILSFITVLVYLLVFKSIVENFSHEKVSKEINYIFIILASIIIFILKIENAIIFILTCVVFYKLSYKQNILMCFFTSLAYWFLIYIPIEYISLNLVFNINYNHLTQNFHINSAVVEIESMIIQNIFMIIIFQVCNHISKFKSFKNKHKKLICLSICIPFLINILIIISVFRIIAIDNFFENFYIVILIIIPTLVLISKMYNFYMMKRNMYSYILDYENKIIKDNVLKEYNYYLDISKEKDKVKSLYHDVKNHMICIRKLCEDKNVEKILEYIDSMESKVNNYKKLNQEFCTGNMIVDSILRVKKSICIEKDIDFFIDVDFSKNNFMDMVDVCTIFSNLIDNAIEACEEINEIDISKKIVLKSKYIDGFCIILIENSKTNDIKVRNNLFLTNKKDSHMHGIGLTNVKKTVKKYFGEVIFNYSKNLFTVKIMIPYKK